MAGALLEKGLYENLISALPATRLFLALTRSTSSFDKIAMVG